MQSPRFVSVVILDALAASAAGCGGGHGANNVAAPAARGCGAALVQQFVGAQLTRTRREKIADQSGASRIRVIRPGRVYTMDYRPARLRINVNKRGRITALDCG